MMLEQALDSNNSDIRLELIRRRINDEDYLHAAIQRLALVLSNEIIDVTQEGGRNERQRKRRK
jgi:hypothetical protein